MKTLRPKTAICKFFGWVGISISSLFLALFAQAMLAIPSLAPLMLTFSLLLLFWSFGLFWAADELTKP